jgi:hypothetical protein
VYLMWLNMWWFESSLLENSRDVPWPAISHTTSLLPYGLNPLALLSNRFLLQRIPTLQLLLCRHWNPKLLAGLQYYRRFITALTTISFIYIAYIRKFSATNIFTETNLWKISPIYWLHYSDSTRKFYRKSRSHFISVYGEIL